MCERLNNLIQRGIIKTDRVLYSFFNDVTQKFGRSYNHDWSTLSVEALNTVQFLVGSRTAESFRVPMWSGTGKGGMMLS